MTSISHSMMAFFISEESKSVTENIRLRIKTVRIATRSSTPQTNVHENMVGPAQIRKEKLSAALSETDKIDVNTAYRTYNINKSTLRRLCRENRILAHKIKGVWYISINSLEYWLSCSL